MSNQEQHQHEIQLDDSDIAEQMWKLIHENMLLRKHLKYTTQLLQEAQSKLPKEENNG